MLLTLLCCCCTPLVLAYATKPASDTLLGAISSRRPSCACWENVHNIESRTGQKFSGTCPSDGCLNYCWEADYRCNFDCDCNCATNTCNNELTRPGKKTKTYMSHSEDFFKPLPEDPERGTKIISVLRNYSIFQVSQRDGSKKECGIDAGKLKEVEPLYIHGCSQNSKEPCCSSYGFCGNTEDFCKESSMDDYSNCVEKPGEKIWDWVPSGGIVCHGVGKWNPSD
mmetsp:Transcript_35767/g.83481  ORF Transcript_35767/g.83481 Transcript_35767/m.83481 type:complete len:225 (-) Transcript_35767:115-789(-)|eukprot:CAMPEP_0119362670 /NCGR_PEP_ID=MMETSP1334-20130426/9667_1 /TAXON_ID=127549 /ORGANISM="Calcidiscus leptoporus, Strain RCC1130" /LENGTH=224 /DNA_ID=CAMNT_0007377909 /DNA_START=46 /DNA_END=720 /DNA_ORIENTATION=+